MQTLLVLVLTLPLQAAIDPADVRDLVRELDAPQKAARDDAERRLTELGAAVLDVLPEPRPGQSAESTLRLQRIRLTLLKARTESNLHDTRVTIAAQGQPLGEVLAEIERQTRNKVLDYRRQFGQQGDELPVTLEVRDAPFWETIDKLAATAGLEPYHFAPEEGLALVGRTAATPWNTKFVRYQGPFRIEARKLTVTRSPGDEQSDLQIEFETAWEPRLHPLFVTVSASKFSGFDDAGNPLVVANPEAVHEIPPQGRASKVDVKLSFVSPPRTAKTIRSLRGTCNVLLPAELHKFEFKNLGERERQEQQAAAATVTLESSRAGNGRVEAVVRLRYQHPANALESHRAWFYKNPTFLVAPDGEKTPPGTIELMRQADDELTLRLLFPAPDDVTRHTLVYQTPADLVSLPVEFELIDLPLP